MPRTSQEQTQERHAFLLELFRQQPNISRPDALEAFKEKFGSTINPKTLNQLREQALREVAHPVAAEEPSSAEPEPEPETEDGAPLPRPAASTSEPLNGAAVAAAQAAQKARQKGGRQRNIFIDAPRENLAFLERVIQQLQDAGATNVRIDHATERWMVLTVDAK